MTTDHNNAPDLRVPFPALHVERIAALTSELHRLPIVMLHGAFHTGATFLTTPDGRDGWALRFARRGHDVFVPDWPAHGRSGGPPLEQLTTRSVASALAILLDETGPAIILAHSAAGPMAWWMAEQQPDRVAALIGIAPGSPGNLVNVLPDDPEAIRALRLDSEAGCPVYSPIDRAVSVDISFIRDFWANSPRFPRHAIEAYASTIVSESPHILNERFNIGGRALKLSRPELVAQRPILIVTGDQDPRHPRTVDERLANYLHGDFVWLPDAGWVGNGHLPMSEDNSDEIADLICQWLGEHGL